jgi:acetyltransferase-like isoleucine patch superfamily enzyme
MRGNSGMPPSKIEIAAAADVTFISHPDRVSGLDQARSIHATARLTVLDADYCPSSGIELGHDVYLGRHVEITAAGGGRIRIDDDTSIQDASIIFGNVQIGSHCLFGKYVFVASRGHRFRDRPTWLIRDQDSLMLTQMPSNADLGNALVRIEDDCWLGQSVVVSPGIYIGRGAVIGANAVVTSDVGPYEVHGGAPNRKIGSRLDFKPPLGIDARDDAAIPYFYRGFRLTQAALGKSRTLGIVEARGAACLVLGHSSGSTLRLAGICLDHGGELGLHLRINGASCGRHVISAGPFEIVATVPEGAPAADHIPESIRRSTYIEIETDSKGNSPSRYGIKTATIERRPN